MKYLKEHYRELLNKLNFFKNSRFIYQGGETPRTPDVQKAAPTKAPKAPATPKKPDDFQKFQDKFDKHMAPFKKLDPAKVKKSVDKFRARLAEIRKDYEAKLKYEYTKVADVDKIMRPDVDKLIASIKARQIQLKLKPVETKPATPAKKPGVRPKGKEQLKKAVGLNKDQLGKALKLVGKNVTDEYVQGELKKALANVKFSPDQIKQLEKGKLQLTPDQLKQVREALFGKKSGRENLKPASKEEFKLVKEFTSWTKLDNFFDDFEDPAFVYLSQKYTITGPDKGKKGIKINGKPVEDIKGLKQYMPENMKDNFDKALNGKLDDKGQKELLDDLKGRVKTNEAMMQLQKTLLSKENLAKIEKAPGAMESLALLLQLFRAIQRAFKDGDWETLGDFMNDWKQAKSPKEMAKRLKASQESYGKALEKDKPKDINVLLKAYLKPRGKEADQLFGKTGPSSKYRIEAKPAIANYLKGELGLGRIATITELTNGRTQIDGYKSDGKKVAIEFFTADNKPKAEVVYFKEVKDEKGKKSLQRQPAIPVEGGVDFANLRKAIGSKKEAPKTPPPTPGKKPPETKQTPQPAPEVKKETINYKALLEGLEKTPDPKEPKEHNMLYAVINSIKNVPADQPEWKNTKGSKTERQAALNKARREFILKNIKVYEPILKAADKLAKLEATPNPKEKSENNDLQKIINKKPNVKGKHPSWAKLRRISNQTERQRVLDSQRRAYILKNYDVYKDVIEGRKKK